MLDIFQVKLLSEDLVKLLGQHRSQSAGKLELFRRERPTRTVANGRLISNQVGTLKS